MVIPFGHRFASRRVICQPTLPDPFAGVEHLHGIEFPPAGECGDPETLAEPCEFGEGSG